MELGCTVSLENFNLAKDIGYEFVELSAIEIMMIPDGLWPYFKENILKAQIPILGFFAFCNDSLPLIGPKANIQDIEKYVTKLVSRGSDLNIKQIGIGAPTARILPEDFSKEYATEQIVQFLHMIAKKAKSHEIDILFEAINYKECNFGNSLEEVLEIVDFQKLDNLNIVWDLYHAIVNGEDWSQIHPHLQYIKHIHICGIDKSDKRRFPIIEDSTIFNELINYLKNINYKYHISIECESKDFYNDAQQSYSLISSIIS